MVRYTLNYIGIESSGWSIINLELSVTFEELFHDNCDHLIYEALIVHGPGRQPERMW